MARRRPSGLAYRRRETDAQRFVRFVDMTAGPDGCWPWLGSVKETGYGNFALHAANRTTIVRAHRFAYELWRGPIPAGLDLDHLCRSRACVNPSHLEPVTRRENLHRSPITNAGKRCCPMCGGPYTIRRSGYRYCRACARTSDRARYHRTKGRRSCAES